MRILRSSGNSLWWQDWDLQVQSSVCLFQGLSLLMICAWDEVVFSKLIVETWQVYYRPPWSFIVYGWKKWPAIIIGLSLLHFQSWSTLKNWWQTKKSQPELLYWTDWLSFLFLSNTNSFFFKVSSLITTSWSSNLSKRQLGKICRSMRRMRHSFHFSGHII